MLHRFIPAGAGNTSPHPAAATGRPVYPCWPGEHSRSRMRISTRAGLSPLARGTLEPTNQPSPSGRFIPAGAGNTAENNRQTGMPPVYPRWRGEHRGRVQPFSVRPGLSPLPRGTQQAENRKMSHARFIPAAAGNTALRSAHLTHQSVYPRCRGEHNRYRKVIRSQNGLPPLARGTRLSHICTQLKERFIPAGAGNTL